MSGLNRVVKSSEENSTAITIERTKETISTEIHYPKGLRVAVVDTTVLTDKGRQATNNRGELVLDEVY